MFNCLFKFEFNKNKPYSYLERVLFEYATDITKLDKPDKLCTTFIFLLDNEQ